MWSGFIEKDGQRARFDLFKNRKVSEKLGGAFAFTIACGEGLAEHWNGNLSGSYTGQNPQYKFSGFLLFGADLFIAELPEMRRRKLLEDSFSEGKNFVRDKTHTVNELAAATPADFKTLDDAITGFVAQLALRNRLMMEDAKSLGYSLDVEQEAFWTYAYYLLGPTAARDQMKEKGGDLFKWKWTSSYNVPKVIRQRIGGWKIVEHFSLFADAGPIPKPPSP
jgi:hypothetical protein